MLFSLSSNGVHALPRCPAALQAGTVTRGRADEIVLTTTSSILARSQTPPAITECLSYLLSHMNETRTSSLSPLP
ncbi:RHTO0S16e00782g1_1 [Rhodotorula toruloides]|uniref:RHTO0S16e00782g1_1 n=2 Tax=Rhodotorula toruloides TaxID=5286 RepID=A0A061BM27_RHOTO|nr:uncharacterized protein RHTO_02187 [Rhodotorula toruloides NP11]EMS20959.1 hypothetical protein RHTO_02187 [Rhodotorula toruloides NP11]CDR48078.1 RHTO0S16e00782g1_1 [Rhodotorula toruloides]